MNNPNNNADADASADTALQQDEAKSGGFGGWLRKARENYESSTNYLNSEVRAAWERDIAHFNNRHAPGSKFHSAAYKHRSKIFRPKARLSGRTAEAAVAAAMFSTNDLVDVKAVNENDAQQAMGAAVQKALLQYRLDHTIPWFLTVVGAYQDAHVYGICASYQCWKFEQTQTEEQAMDETGQPMVDPFGEPVMAQRRETVMDKPAVEMIAPENIRFDPGCDWRDPVNSSPFLIRIVPIYAEEVMKRMVNGEWIPLPPSVIRAANRQQDNESVKRAREKGRPDQAQDGAMDNPLVYVHENFVRVDGQEYVYWTLGTKQMLSEPRLLKDYYVIGERPIVIGRVVIETHKPYPSSKSGLSHSLIEAGNELANQRADNVSLVLNKRYAIKRGRQIDFESLMRNVPGGGIVTDDPVGDLRVIETPDVTGSSYQEQDRIDTQIDEMQGTFSGSAVQANRSLGDTVGGLKLLNGSASAISEYDTRVFVETWVEPVLRQLLKLESAYETDALVLSVAGREAKLERFGVSEINDQMLMAQCTVKVNVGIGATNPQQKIDRIRLGLQAVADLPEIGSRINVDEVIKEVFGALGYDNGSRFINGAAEPGEEGAAGAAPPPDPMIEVKMKELELKQAALELESKKIDSVLQAKQMEIQADSERWAAELSLKRELGLADLALRENLTTKQLTAKLQSESLRDQSARDIKALVETNKQNEMQLKRELGSGI